jgi:hypothetical protein
MKDCKWNPPTNGIKAQHYDANGVIIPRERLNEIPDGDVMLKYFDESGSKLSRARAKKQVEKWRESGELAKILAGFSPLPEGWTLHLRESAADREDAAVLAARALGIPALSGPGLESLRAMPRYAQAMSALINGERLHRLAPAPRHNAQDYPHIQRLAYESRAGVTDLTSFVRHFNKSYNVIAAKNPDALGLDGHAAVLAMRAKWVLDKADLFAPENEHLLEMFSYSHTDRYHAEPHVKDRVDEHVGNIDADLLVAVAPLLGSDWRGAAKAIATYRRHDYQNKAASDFNNGRPISYARIFSRLNAFHDLQSEHADSAGLLCRLWGNSSHEVLTQVMRAGVHTQRRALLLAADVFIAEQEAQEHGGVRLPDALSARESRLEPTRRFYAIARQLEIGLQTGVIAGTFVPHAVAYLNNQSSARPVAAIARGSNTPRTGHISADSLGLDSLSTPSKVLKAAARVHPHANRFKTTDKLLDGTPSTAKHGGTKWDVVDVSANPTAQELVCVAALAASRPLGDSEMLDAHRLQLADRLAKPLPLAALAKEAAAAASSGRRVSAELRARTAASGLAYELAADTAHPDSFFGVKEFTDACQDLFAHGAFELPADRTPGSLRALERLTEELKTGEPTTSRSPRPTSGDREFGISRDTVRFLAEEASLARMRAAVGDQLGITAAPFVLTIENDEQYAKVALAVAPGADTQALADRVEALAQPWRVTVRNHEVLIELADGADPFEALERLEGLAAASAR